MTALALRLDPGTRRRLLDRFRELEDLNRLLSQPGHQRPAPEPEPLTVLARRPIAGLPCDEVMKEGNPP